MLRSPSNNTCYHCRHLKPLKAQNKMGRKCPKTRLHLINYISTSKWAPASFSVPSNRLGALPGLGPTPRSVLGAWKQLAAEPKKVGSFSQHRMDYRCTYTLQTCVDLLMPTDAHIHSQRARTLALPTPRKTPRTWTLCKDFLSKRPYYTPCKTSHVHLKYGPASRNVGCG